MSASTPKKGYTVPSPDGSDAIKNISSIVYQMGLDIEDYGLLDNNAKPASDGPDSYPVGVSVMSVSLTYAQANGWTGNGGMVLSVRRASGGLTCQLYLGSGTASGTPSVKYRFGNTAGWVTGWYSITMTADS